MVATAPTVYGIETDVMHLQTRKLEQLQQHLPFTVLKHFITIRTFASLFNVATAPTVYGIETQIESLINQCISCVATAPTVYGIETRYHDQTRLATF